MKTVRDLVISIKEPKNTNIGWLKPTDDANYTLNFFNRGKWTGISISNICKEVTYSQLKGLRDNAKLVPGCYYRITDYQCTTSQSNIKSAGHQFDIIVRADSENKLNEEASAIQHEGDEYFANSNLSAWKIWYCLDNDTTRFVWANSNIFPKESIYVIGTATGDASGAYTYNAPISKITFKDNTYNLEIGVKTKIVNDPLVYVTKTDDYTLVIDDRHSYISNYGGISVYTISPAGKGVIYRMIDEFNNDVPYDFKNIIYQVTPSFLYTLFGSKYKLTRDSSIDTSINGIQYYGYISELIPPAWDENKCWIKEETPTINSKLYKRDGSEINSRGIISNIKLDKYETYTFGRNEDLSKAGICYSNIVLPYYKAGILILNNITFYSDCYNNIFGNDCYNNIFGTKCYNNTFGTNCYENSFGDYCFNNFFGNSCDHNSFEGNYFNNYFGNHCFDNSFRNFCYNNSFGNHCFSNIFGNRCICNLFRNNCSFNLFEDYCSNNSFGNDCSYIKFASDSSATTKYKYYQNNHFGDGCGYIVFTGAETASLSAQVQNYNFAQGLRGISNSYLTIDGIRNRIYETKVAKNSNGELKIYCEADLVQQ